MAQQGHGFRLFVAGLAASVEQVFDGDPEALADGVHAPNVDLHALVVLEFRDARLKDAGVGGELRLCQASAALAARKRRPSVPVSVDFTAAA